MKIESKLIKDLKPATYNPRQISTKQYKDLKASVKKFGLVDPIIVNKDMTVIGGHQRLKICKELKHTEIDCVVLDLSKEEERELNIRLNKNTGDFDMDILANEFDIDELTDWGFKHIDLDINIDKITEGNTEDDHIPEVKESRVKLGDVWQLGKHRLMCGDNMNLMKQYEDNYFDLAIDDPPYGINQDATQEKLANKKGFNKQAGTYKKYHEQKWDRKIPSKNYFNKLTNICKNHIVWGGNYFFELKDTGVIIWYKGNSGNFKEGEFAKTNLNVFKVFQYSRADAYINDCENKVHPTQKPIKLYLWLINEFSKKGDKILDCHLGSGTTLIACEKTNRICYGMELDTKYCDVIIERWEQFTGQKATKL